MRRLLALLFLLPALAFAQTKVGGQAIVGAPIISPHFSGVPQAPTAAADTNTLQIANTTFVLGQAGASNPLIDGTAAPGTSLRYARQDHVHPTDTTRAPVASPTFTGTVTAPTVVTSATSGQHAEEITSGSLVCLDGATCSQNLRYNAGDAASIPGAQAWITPTLLNSWVNYGGGTATVAYYRDIGGTVRLRGTIKSGTLAAAAFVLPAGYRPPALLVFACDSQGAFGRVTVDASGNVAPAIGLNTAFSLDGISFRAEQ